MLPPICLITLEAWVDHGDAHKLATAALRPICPITPKRRRALGLNFQHRDHTECARRTRPRSHARGAQAMTTLPQHDHTACARRTRPRGSCARRTSNILLIPPAKARCAQKPRLATHKREAHQATTSKRYASAMRTKRQERDYTRCKST